MDDLLARLADVEPPQAHPTKRETVFEALEKMNQLNEAELEEGGYLADWDEALILEQKMIGFRWHGKYTDPSAIAPPTTTCDVLTALEHHPPRINRTASWLAIWSTSSGRTKTRTQTLMTTSSGFSHSLHSRLMATRSGVSCYNSYDTF